MKKYLISKPGVYDIKLQLSKEGERLEWLGIVNARKEGDYELNLLISHVAIETYGRVLIKAVAENGAKIRINGMVRIEKLAQETDSFLAMKVLLLDKKSTAVVEPELEILANRVKASHSASVGRIDEEQVFYLTSRGVKKEEAKKLITAGFLN